MIVVEGTDTESLKKGPGHYSNTAYPWEDSGRVGIAGHRTTYGAPFWSLDKLRPGDPITLQTEYGIFAYSVTRVVVTDPSGTLPRWERAGSDEGSHARAHDVPTPASRPRSA